VPHISSTEPATGWASTKENPRLPYATGSTGLALTVRGSSRRIMIMRSRPANIRLINRRQNLPRLLLALCSRKNNCQNKPTEVAALTGSLHIRANRSSSSDLIGVAPVFEGRHIRSSQMPLRMCRSSPPYRIRETGKVLSMDGASKKDNNGRIKSAGANFPCFNLCLTCRECDRIHGLPLWSAPRSEQEVRQWSIS
jgi:hypothetical protein